MELTWEDHRLFLAELSAFPEIEEVEFRRAPKFPLANIRVMVPNVDTAGEWLMKSPHGSWCQLAIGITACATSRWLTRTDLVFASRVCCRARTAPLKSLSA